MPSKYEKEFFIDGMLIKAEPGEMPADVYLRYEERQETDEIYKKWRAFDSNFLHECLRFDEKNLTDIRSELKKLRNYRTDLSTAVTEIIIERLLKILQREKLKKLTQDELREKYKTAICDSAEIESCVSFDTLLSSVEFTYYVTNWKHSVKIASAVNNQQLSEALKRKRLKKINKGKVLLSLKWHEKYAEYEKATNLLDQTNFYNISLHTFFNDFESGQYPKSETKFVVQKKDLFNPKSQFNINKLISAALNKDWVTQHPFLTVKEFMTISDKSNVHRIVFGYNYDRKNKKWLLADEQIALPEDSVYSLPRNVFSRMANWQQTLKGETSEVVTICK